MTPQPTRLRRRWLYIPFAVAGVIVLGYYLLWRAGAEEMQKGVAQWVDDQRAAGFTVAHGEVRPDGFPFFLRVHIDNPDVTTPEGWRWRADRLSLDALPYELNKLIFSPAGAQTVSAEGYGEWRIAADDLRASIAADEARGWSFSATVGDAEAVRAEDGARATLGSLIFDLAPDAANATTLILSLAAKDIALTADDVETAVGRFETVMGMTETQALNGRGAAAQWRGAGGALIINGLIAEIEQATLSVAGSLGLDPAHYPAGQLRAEIVNPAGLAGPLSDTGVLTREEADAAAAGLTLMAIAGGGKVAAPIDFKDGAAQIAGIKIADLPKVE